VRHKRSSAGKLQLEIDRESCLNEWCLAGRQPRSLRSRDFKRLQRMADPDSDSLDIVVKIADFLRFETDARLYSKVYTCGGHLYVHTYP
jgi:hypothetical protein